MAGGPTLVTGARGFAGSHLLDRLSGREPLVAWHRPERAAPDAVPGVDWRAVDVRDRASVRAAVAATRPARIYHLAGAPHVDTAWRDVVPHLEANVLGTHYLLEAVREAALACRVLVVSSGMVYAPRAEPIDEDAPLVPATPYGLSKLAQDQLALRAAVEDHLDIVVARPFNHAGPRQDAGFAVSSFARQIALIEAGQAPPELHVGNLDARRDFTDVRDVAAAYEQLLDRAPAGRPFNVCSGVAVRIGDVLDRLLAVSHTRIRVVIDETRLRPVDVPVLEGNPSRIRAEVGWTPHLPLDQTLHDTLAWWRGHVGCR